MKIIMMKHTINLQYFMCNITSELTTAHIKIALDERHAMKCWRLVFIYLFTLSFFSPRFRLDPLIILLLVVISLKLHFGDACALSKSVCASAQTQFNI